MFFYTYYTFSYFSMFYTKIQKYQFQTRNHSDFAETTIIYFSTEIPRVYRRSMLKSQNITIANKEVTTATTKKDHSESLSRPKTLIITKLITSSHAITTAHAIDAITIPAIAYHKLNFGTFNLLTHVSILFTLFICWFIFFCVRIIIRYV